MAITSRQNPIVSRFRDAANGDGTSVLLDGAHLVADAIAANAAIALAAVTTVSRAKPEIAAIADSLAQRGVEVTTVGVSVMNAISPVRSPARIGAIAARRHAGVRNGSQRPGGDSRRRRGARAAGGDRGRRRRARHDSDAAAGRIAQRRGYGRRHPVRSVSAAAVLVVQASEILTLARQ